MVYNFPIASVVGLITFAKRGFVSVSYIDAQTSDHLIVLEV